MTLEEIQPLPLRRSGSSAGGYVGSSGYSLSERTRRTAARLARDYDLTKRQGWPIRPLRVYCVVYEVPPGLSLEEVMVRLAEDARVESVQPMHEFEVQSGYDDPYAEMQHGMEAMRVWETHTWAAGRGVSVAVVDTAVDRHHPDLAGNVVLIRDFVTDGETAREVAEFHGTAVAGVIASSADNGIGTVGVAPAAEILALRACWQPAADGVSGRCNSFTLAKALAFVVERRPEVVNLSLAGPPDPLLERLIRVALAEGVAVVTAYRYRAGSVAFPASVDGVLAVGSPAAPLDGETPAPLAAPAEDILTATPGGGFDFVSGSSFAAAHVSGVLALLLERAPGLVVERLRDVLRRTARRVPGDSGLTLPLVDACAALDQVATGGECVRGATRGSQAAASR